jgi:hypothetical protein
MHHGMASGLILVVANLTLATACTRESDLASLADRPTERRQGPWCVPDGPRVLRAGLRRATWCIANYAEGNAMWRRDAFDHVISAGRMWHLWEEDAARWSHLRDSVTAAAKALAKGTAPCLMDAPFGNGGRVTVWELPGYELAVERFDPWPDGGYEVRIGVQRGHRRCPASRGPAT